MTPSERCYLGSSDTQGRSCPVSSWVPQALGRAAHPWEEKILPHPFDQALTTQPPDCFGLCCFSIISFVSAVKQELSAMFPCPLNFTSAPPVSPWWFPQAVHSFCRAGHVWLAFIPRAECLNAALGIFVPRCAVGHKRRPPAGKLCWMGSEMIEMSFGMLGSRYHSSFDGVFCWNLTACKAWCSFDNFLLNCGKSVLHLSYLQWKGSGHKGPQVLPLELQQELIKIKSFKKPNVSTSAQFHTLSHSCRSVSASTWGMLRERNEQLGGSRRSQRKEEGEKKISFSGNIISFQVHIKLWAHCTLMLVALLLKRDLQGHLFGLVYCSLFSQKPKNT